MVPAPSCDLRIEIARSIHAHPVGYWVLVGEILIIPVMDEISLKEDKLKILKRRKKTKGEGASMSGHTMNKRLMNE